MLKAIDNFLNAITMYRVVLYGLLVIAIAAFIFSFFGVIPYNFIDLIKSLLILLSVSYIVNHLFGKLFNAPLNLESWSITALILFLLMAPPTNNDDIAALLLAAAIAMASKYIFAINKKHIFNPTAISVFILGLLGSSSVFWWVGSIELLPVVLIVGLLIVRKIRRFHLFFSFLITSVVLITISGLQINPSIFDSLKEAFVSWPLIFFGTIMLTEPLTTPPTKNKQIIYGGLVGILFTTQFHFGPLYASPELALIIGNIYSYLVSPKQKLFLTFKQKNKLAPDIYEFVFTKNQKVNFTPGQYLEWTMPHSPSDSRGNRRYFTVASSPSENEVKLGVKISDKLGSSFKRELLTMKPGKMIVAAQLAGDFTLPKDESKKLVFIAGGIGVTPFRSIIQYLLDTNKKRDTVLFYATADPRSFVFKNVFQKAQKDNWLKTVYVITNPQNAPKNWSGKTGYITEAMIKSEVPDYKDRVFYLSGPIAMVDNYKKVLSNLGVSKTNIVTDYFPGF